MTAKDNLLSTTVLLLLICSSGAWGDTSDPDSRKLNQLPKTVEEIKALIADAKRTTDKVISARPFRVDGHIIGYTLVLPNQTYTDLYLGFDFLPNDVFAKVNGITLANQQNAIRAMESVATTYSIEAVLIRDGEIIEISVQLK